jgi:hypothetical protein
MAKAATATMPTAITKTTNYNIYIPLASIDTDELKALGRASNNDFGDTGSAWTMNGANVCPAVTTRYWLT